MPRGIRKQIDYNFEISQIDDQLEKLTEKANELLACRKQLENDQHNAQVAILMKLMSANNLSVNDIEALIAQRESA